MKGNYMSPRELAEFSGWPERRIRNLISSGQLRHVKVGAIYLLPKTAIDEFIKLNMVEPCQDNQPDQDLLDVKERKTGISAISTDIRKTKRPLNKH